MQQQKVIFLNKVLSGIVQVLIVYLGISLILIFTPKKGRLSGKIYQKKPQTCFHQDRNYTFYSKTTSFLLQKCKFW